MKNSIFIQSLQKIWFQWKEVIIITALIRVILLILSTLTTVPGTGILDVWNQWDGPHYIDIAQNGYQVEGPSSLFIVFYPLYPILIKIVSFFIGDFVSSMILISISFSFTASILLYELARLDYDKKTALLSVWFLNIFPTAFFLQASYTESLFLTMSLSTIYFYRKQKFLYSGIFGLLSSLTRINGILLLPLLLFESKISKKNILALLLTPVGFLIYLYVNYFYFNNPFYFNIPLYSHWHKRFDFPWSSIDNLLTQVSYYPPYYLPEMLALVVAFLATIYTFLKIRKSYGIYLFLNLILFTSTSFILSTPRYILILFPIYFILARMNKFLIILTSSFFIIFLLFYTSLYINGGWAF